jgi:hypothetical protein
MCHGHDDGSLIGTQHLTPYKESAIQNVAMHSNVKKKSMDPVYMGQSPPWEDNSHSAGEDISLLLRNPKIHYRIHKTSGLHELKSR